MQKELYSDLQNLIGARIISISHPLPVFRFDNGTTLAVECPWRVTEADAYIQIGYIEFRNDSTHEEGLRILNGLILNKPITGVQQSGKPGDLQLTFGGNVLLEIMPCSGLYENWNLRFANITYMCLPGGKLDAVDR